MVTSLQTLVFSFQLLLTVVTAQNFAIPSSWKYTPSSLSFGDRISTSQAVIDTVTSSFNPSNGLSNELIFSQSASFLAAVSILDINAGGSNSYSSFVDNMMDASGTANLGFYLSPLPQMNIDSVNWGLAAMYGYRAYGLSSLLGHATGVWTETNSHFIQTDQAANGSHYEVSIPFSPTCNSATVAGGLFPNATTPNTQVNNAIVNADAVTAFMALSAHLYDIVRDSQYQNAAQLAAEFIKNQLYNGQLVVDSIDLASCSRSTGLSTNSQGFFIDGLSIYVANTKDATWSTFLDNLINATVTNPGWTNSNGVNTDASNLSSNDLSITDRSILFRGLYQAWNQTSASSSIAQLIESYTNVQYNAILASAAGGNKYSSNWLGSPPAQSQAWSQLSVLDVLNAEIKLPVDAQGSSSASSNGAPMPTSSQGTDLDPTPAPVKSHTGMIVGIAVGVSILVLLTALVAFFLIRRHRRNANGPRPDLLENTPFTYDQSYTASNANMLPHATSQTSQSFPTIPTPPHSVNPPTAVTSSSSTSTFLSPAQTSQTQSSGTSYPRDVKVPLPSPNLIYTNPGPESSHFGGPSSASMSRYGSELGDVPPQYQQ